MDSIDQLNASYLRALKRALGDQNKAGSAHLSEAIAKALGYRTHAALNVELKSGSVRLVKFDEVAFRERLEDLTSNPLPSSLSLPPLPLELKFRMTVAIEEANAAIDFVEDPQDDSVIISKSNIAKIKEEAKRIPAAHRKFSAARTYAEVESACLEAELWSHRVKTTGAELLGYDPPDI